VKVRRLTVVMVGAVIVLAGAWQVRKRPLTPPVHCGDFVNQVEAQIHLRDYLNPPHGVMIDYAPGRDPGPKARREAEQAWLDRYVSDQPKVVKALDPDGDGRACNKGPGQLAPGPVPECADYDNQQDAQSGLQPFLDPPESVERMTTEQAREYLASYAADQPRVIKEMDPDGDGRACNKAPLWLPPKRG
jgi:hypothetical protein